MSQPERHHYVPAFYLAEFASERDRYKGRLRVFDVRSGRAYGGTPDTQAFERDLYRVETTDPKDALVLESQFAGLEGKCAPLLRAMNDTGKLLKDDELAILLALVAFQAVRVPAVIDKIERFQSNLLMKILRMSLAAGPEAFHAQALRINPAWTEADIAEIKTDLEGFLSAKNPSIKFDQTSLLKIAIKGAGPIGDELVKRGWSLGLAPQGCSLITSDDPVVFQHMPGSGPPAAWSPGFGRNDTIVVWPIGPKHALFGYPRLGPPREHNLSAESVAQINTILALGADERVYFSDPGFRHFDLMPPAFDNVVDGPTDALIRK
jgi:Protein of unknown function (DUF4238)